jgi:tripartite-type tricarboxylate transporter receptor subunit TctC
VFPDLIAGRVQVTFSDIVAAYPHVQSGRVRVLGVTSPKRVAGYPDVPTIAEAGVPGYEAVGWFGVFAPAGTPPAIVTKLRDAIASQMSKPETRKTLEAQGAEPVASTPEQFAAVLQTDIARWAKVVKESGAKVD